MDPNVLNWPFKVLTNSFVSEASLQQDTTDNVIY